MKISCDVIKDLLALYVDKVLSKDSTALVDEHLLECADCRAELKEMAQDAKVAMLPEQDITAKQALGVLSKGIKKVMRWRVILSALLTAAVISLGFWGYNYYFVDYNKVVNPQVIDTQFRVLKNGRLIFGVKRNDGKPIEEAWRSGSSDDWDESEINIGFLEPILPLREIIPQYTPGLVEDGYVYNDLFGTNIVDGIVYEYGNLERPLGKITMGVDQSPDRKVIWSEGDDMQPASEQLEKAFELYGYSDTYSDFDDEEGDGEEVGAVITSTTTGISPEPITP